MKASLLKRLQHLEHAASVRERVPLALVDVTKMPEADREAYWAGNVGVLRQFGAPDPSGYPEGSVHTIVIDVHPACRDLRQDDDDHADADA